MNDFSGIRHFQRHSSIPLPATAIPEGSDLYQYDTDVILFYYSGMPAWYEPATGTYYKPGTVMEVIP